MTNRFDQGPPRQRGEGLAEEDRSRDGAGRKAAALSGRDVQCDAAERWKEKAGRRADQRPRAKANPANGDFTH
jgi:hypothetical protein